jgi:type IX secretion system PorP/SprF family membrane protein
MKNLWQFVPLLLVISAGNYAQQTAILNQTSYNLFAVNPGAIGISNELTLNCQYKKNWPGIAESPESTRLTLDGPVTRNIGLGLNLANERAGIFSKVSCSGAFRYKIKLKAQSDLFFGISGGMQRQSADFSKIKAESPDEFSAWPVQQCAIIPDATFGMAFTCKKFLLAASACQVLSRSFTYKEALFNNNIGYNQIPVMILIAQYKFISTSGLIAFHPSLIVRSPQGLPFQPELSGTLYYNNALLVGVGYRFSCAYFVNAGFIVNNKLRFIYSYEYASGINGVLNGCHEVGLAYSPKGNVSHSKNFSRREETALQEIYEKLDQDAELMEKLRTKIDSIDRNLIALRNEAANLNSRQVTNDDIVKAISVYMSRHEKKSVSGPGSGSRAVSGAAAQPSRYKMINPKTGTEPSEIDNTIKANYKMVLGVYQVLPIAKQYQQFLRREMKIETTLLQLEDSPNNYLYVCTKAEYTNLNSALSALYQMRTEIKAKPIQITRGEAWILQTLNR